MAAMRRAMTSKSSSRVCGFSGKKSPWRCMNSSKAGWVSSPLARMSSMRLRSASMSLSRCMSSGDWDCIDPAISLTYCCMSCSRSRSMSSSKRCWASAEVKS